MLRAQKEIFTRSSFKDFSKAKAAYMLFSNNTYQFYVLPTLAESLLSLSRTKTLVNVGGPLKGMEGANTAAFNGSANKDDAIRYKTYFMFHPLYSLI